jgi:hypothetical protein
MTTTSSCKTNPTGNRRRFACAIVLAALLSPSTGCVQLGGLLAVASGGDVIDPEYTLTKHPLLIFIDDLDGMVSEPVAIRELHRGLSAVFLDFDVNRNVIPYEDLQRLMRSDRKSNELSIRQIGEKLGAEQVLYIRVERFTLHAEPGAPLFEGEFEVRVKVISTDHARDDPRLWPREQSGRRLVATTDPTPTDGGKSASDIARQLSQELAKDIGRLFREYRTLDE